VFVFVISFNCLVFLAECPSEKCLEMLNCNSYPICFKYSINNHLFCSLLECFDNYDTLVTGSALAVLEKPLAPFFLVAIGLLTKYESNCSDTWVNMLCHDMPFG